MAKPPYADGVCKFCGRAIWWNPNNQRWYDIGGETYHSNSCEGRKGYYSNIALQNHENMRQKKER